MTRRILISCLAALVLINLPRWASASRAKEPLQVMDSSVMYSSGTGQTVLFASLILPHSDTLAGTTVTLTIGEVATTFVLDKKGNAKSLDSKAAVKLGKPTCSCADSSHLARLSVVVKGSKKKKSVFATQGGTPTNATVQFGYLGEAINFDSSMIVRK